MCIHYCAQCNVIIKEYIVMVIVNFNTFAKERCSVPKPQYSDIKYSAFTSIHSTGIISIQMCSILVQNVAYVAGMIQNADLQNLWC